MSPLIKLLRLATLTLAASAAFGLGWIDRKPAPDDALVLYGNVDVREVEMAFRQSGRLVKMAFDEGDQVQAGELLAELDAQPFREAVAAAAAEVQRAKADLEKLKRGYRVQEVAEAEQSVRKAEAALAFAESELRRQGAVVGSGATTRHAYDQARSARDQAAADLASARESLAMRKEGYRREDIAAAEARVAAATASLAQAKTALGDARLFSPSHASVLSRVREPGSMVNAATPVYTLSLRDPVYIRAYVGERELGRVVPGTKVSVRTDSSGKTYEGQVGFVSPRAEFTPKSVETTELRTDLVYRLRIVVANADENLRQGMPVTIHVDTAPAATGH
jgi:HlyD family secretion protein